MLTPPQFLAPPPRDPAGGAEVIRHLTRGLRWNAWIGAAIPVLFAAAFALIALAKHRPVSLSEDLAFPFLGGVVFAAIPMALYARSGVAAVQRLYRDGVVVPGALSGMSVAPSGVVWVDVRFEPTPGVPYSMRTNVLEPASTMHGVTACDVLVDPGSPGLATLLTPSARLVVGRATRVG